MFQTFSGSSRRPRHVNLSGRNTNQFPNKPGYGPGSQNALASAQQDRLARQQERERIQAATLLQKTWRGNVVRKSVKESQRRWWDEVEARAVRLSNEDAESAMYETDDDALSQLWLLLRFVDIRREEDLMRLRRYFERLVKTKQARKNTCSGGPWPSVYLRLEDTCLNALERRVPHQECAALLGMLQTLSKWIPKETAHNSTKYYHVLTSLILNAQTDLDTIVAPLQSMEPSTIVAYQGFAVEILTIPHLSDRLGGEHALALLAAKTNYKLLGRAVADMFRSPYSAINTYSSYATSDNNPLFGNLSSAASGSFPPAPHTTSSQRSQASISTSFLEGTMDETRLWLLGHLIYFYRHAHNFRSPERYASDQDFVLSVATLLSSLVDYVEVESTNLDADFDPRGARGHQGGKMVDSFVREQILSLVNQESIGGLLMQMGTKSGKTILSDGEHAKLKSDSSRVLASYILTLLRMFPRRSDEIRMWLYLGSSSIPSASGSEAQPPVIRYFWQAATKTRVYEAVSDDPRAAITLLKARTTRQESIPNRLLVSGPDIDAQAGLDDQWRVVLIFIELYMFVLKVMDDEEFFSNSRAMQASQASQVGQQNTLLLTEIHGLITFLKHLGFVMYYNAPDILEPAEGENNQSISNFFRLPGSSPAIAQSALVERTPSSFYVAGMRGVSLDYVKGLVTGLLRALYERDSRRPFLPKNHWLMTSRFDMTNLIDAVVEEEERRNKVQEEDDEDDATSEAENQTPDPRSGLIGASRARNEQKFDRMRRQQRKASRKRYLQAVAPRLEILQNMPFLIPFTTRVQIFRRFVHLDQMRRRNGVVDSETWRFMQTQRPDGSTNPLQRHHATIRREHEFEDAYDTFYDLGAGLKEPIQITFVDKFDSLEAGIDGGGVTKEFLTSVTNQAFALSDGINLFVENEQHLLYPNPSAVDEQKELLREAGFKEDMPMYRTQVSDLLQRYEFLGRIIGKCLYEGILVDIGFAGFFLLKWALTGGTGAAPRESGYRANLNDLRDFDEGLYQGLLQLKNYQGNVEDFSLNFTVSDTISLVSAGTTKTVTRDLKPGGSTIPVTNSNRLVYISYMARHRLSSQPYFQTTAFLRGLASIIQPSWLSMFNQSELQTLVGGAASSISVADLRANTLYGGVYSIGDDGQEHESVKIFWEVMQEFKDEDRRKVLKFVTSTPRAPLLGFSSLTPRFSIRDAGDDETRLPTTSTCVNLLKLPRYTRKAACKVKLLQAVNSGAGFDLS